MSFLAFGEYFYGLDAIVFWAGLTEFKGCVSMESCSITAEVLEIVFNALYLHPAHTPALIGSFVYSKLSRETK